jgi:four helix bundle protein
MWCSRTVLTDTSFRMGDLRNLLAWKEAKSLVVLSRDLIRRLPAEERYALADQWRRASQSVALNIAEGATRRGPKEFRRYLDIARASLHEMEAIFELVAALGYLSEADLDAIARCRNQCARLVYGLLRRMAQAATRDGATS